MSGAVKVLVVGQTPPPWHGQAVMIDRLLRAQYERVRLYHVRMAFSDSIDDVGRFRLRKLFHLLGVVLRIAYHRVVHGTKVLYYPPAGPNRVPMYRDLVILLSTRWMFRRTILHFHAGGISELYPQLSRPIQWLFRRALFGADAAVRISHGSPPDAIALEAKREFVVPYGIEDAPVRFENRRSVHRSIVNRSNVASPSGSVAVCEAAPLRIFFMGILRESKGLMTLIEACGQLVARGVPFELRVAGRFQSADFETAVRRRIVEFGISQSVTFLGELVGNAKWDAYANSDVFCFPTYYEAETFGIVLVEAMSVGLPVVATRWRGIPEIVDEGQTGFLVAPHDIWAVAERLEQLHSDPALREQLGAKAREKFLSEFTVGMFWQRMEQAFLETAGA